jgi:hypothetical protein
MILYDFGFPRYRYFIRGTWKGSNSTLGHTNQSQVSQVHTPSEFKFEQQETHLRNPSLGRFHDEFDGRQFVFKLISSTHHKPNMSPFDNSPTNQLNTPDKLFGQILISDG